MKKALCFLLAVGILISVSACVPGISEDTSWEIEDGVLSIHGEGDIGCFCTPAPIDHAICYDKTEIPWYGLEYHTVILGEGITSINAHAFTDAPSLKKVIIQGKNVKVEHFAFYNCKNLQEIVNSEAIVSMQDGAFSNCVSLKSIELGSEIREVSNYMLNQFYFKDYFYGCTALERVEIHEDNQKLESVDGVVYTKGMGKLAFYPMGKPEKSFVVPDVVETICEEAFSRVQCLESVTIAGCDIEEDAFVECPSLKTVVVGKDVYIKPTVFQDCIAMECFQVTEDNTTDTTREGVLYHSLPDGRLVMRCYPPGKKDSSFTVPEEVSDIWPDAFKNSCHLENIDFAGQRMTAIRDGAFRSCSSLKTITIPSSVTDIAPGAFGDAKGFTIRCYKNSAAEAFAKSQGIEVDLLRDDAKSHYDTLKQTS